MQVEAGPGLTLSCVFEVTDQHQGAPGLSHGGVLSAAHASAGPDGPVVARASALYIQVRRGHFREHGRPQDVAAAVARGEDSDSAELNP